MVFAYTYAYLNAIYIHEFDVTINTISKVMPCEYLLRIRPGAVDHGEVASILEALYLKLEVVDILPVVEEEACKNKDGYGVCVTNPDTDMNTAD